LRRTEQALLQVIDAARCELLIVSFAVYKIDAIIEALIRAFERGVRLRICVEAPEPSGQRMAYDTIAALGPDVGQRAAIYIWPRGQRQVGPNGKPGSLHAKLAVADDTQLFISSANLTGYAMNLNMELGVLIQGGRLPGQVAAHFAALIREGVLVRVG
jgi:phosphatidylserine/phosphatidylglycerophosphate/cardiolipin synthase-like enzyme